MYALPRRQLQAHCFPNEICRWVGEGGGLQRRAPEAQGRFGARPGFFANKRKETGKKSQRLSDLPGCTGESTGRAPEGVEFRDPAGNPGERGPGVGLGNGTLSERSAPNRSFTADFAIAQNRQDARRGPPLRAQPDTDTRNSRRQDLK